MAHGIVLAPSDLQALLDDFRRERELSAAEDFARWLTEAGLELNEVLAALRRSGLRMLAERAGFGVAGGEVRLSANACRLLPVTALVEGYWPALAERVALMVAAYEAEGPEITGPASNAAVEFWARSLGVSRARLPLLAAVARRFADYSAELAHDEKATQELELQKVNLTSVATVEAHCASLDQARELFWSARGDHVPLGDASNALGIECEHCAHQVATLRARPGWSAVAFGLPGEVFLPGVWDGRHVVVQVVDRRPAQADDARVQQHVVLSLAKQELVRQRGSVEILMR